MADGFSQGAALLSAVVRFVPGSGACPGTFAML